MISPKGKLLFVHVNGVEGQYEGKKNGKYEATLEISKESYEKLMSELNDIWEQSKEYQELKDEVDIMAPTFGLKKKKDSEGVISYRLSARTNRFKKNKDGSTREITIPIKDGHLNRIPDDTFIRNGCEGRVMFYPAPRKISSTNYGLTLYLQEIQVTNLVERPREDFPEEETTEDIPF